MNSFGVSTALVTIRGMNFECSPELKRLCGYPAALITIASAAVGLYWRSRRTRRL